MTFRHLMPCATKPCRRKVSECRGKMDGRTRVELQEDNPARHVRTRVSSYPALSLHHFVSCSVMWNITRTHGGHVVWHLIVQMSLGFRETLQHRKTKVAIVEIGMSTCMISFGSCESRLDGRGGDDMTRVFFYLWKEG